MKVNQRNSYLGIFAVSLGCLVTTSAQAQTTWTGANSTWNDANNWSAGIPTIATSASFDSIGSTSVDLGGAVRDLKDLTFNSGAQGYTFSGSAGDVLNFESGGFINVNAGVLAAETLNSALGLNGSLTVTNHDTTHLLTLNGNVALSSGTAGLLTVNGAGNATINGAIASGAISGLTKSGIGTLILGAGNAHAGTTTITEGTITTNADGAFGTGPLLIGNATTATSTVGTLNIGGNESVASLTVGTNTASVNTISIGSGKVLTVNGAFTVGNVADSQTTNLTVTGGTLAVNNASADINLGRGQATSSGNSFATVDLSGLEAFTADVSSFNLSKRNGANRTYATNVFLSNLSNTITASTVTINDTQGNQFTNNANGGTPSILTLGAGTNTINTDNLVIGQAHGLGILTFASQSPGSPGDLTLRGKGGTGTKVNITLANNNNTGQSAIAAGTLDLRGHLAHVNGGALIIGNAVQTSNTGGGTGTLSFDAGTFDVDSINMAFKSGAGTGPITAIINVGGGAFTVNTSTPIIMGTFASGSSSSSSSTATINITGGTFTSNADIKEGPEATAGKVTSTINLDGGTLDMTGHVLGASGALITNLNLKTGTLKNVGQINNGAALTKNTAGTLNLDGNNTYTGATNITNGTLSVGNGGTTGTLGSGNVTVTSPGTLQFNRNDAYSILNTINGTGTVTSASASGVVSLTATNNYSGGTTISSGTLSVGDGGTTGTLGSGNVAIASPGTLQLNRTGTYSFANSTSDSGNLNVVNAGGIVTFTGTLGHTGNTSIAAGTARLSPSSSQLFSTLGTTTVADGATLIVTPFNTSATVATVGALNLGSSLGGNLNFELLGTPTSVPLATTTLNTSGTTLINISTIGALNGQFPLVSYTGSIGGSGFSGLALGTLPLRTAASLVDNTSNSSVDLSVTSDTIRWNGGVNGTWDINSTSNWKEIISGNTTTYLQATPPGETVTFDDNAAGNFDVDISTAVNPLLVTFNNSSNDYTLSGGALTTPTLLKNGSGKATLANSGGALSIPAIVLNDGTLAVNRSDDFALDSTISGVATFSQEGTNILTLTGNNTGFTGTISVVASTLKVGNPNALGNSTTNVESGATLDLDGNTLSTNVVTLAGTGNVNVPTPAGLQLDRSATYTISNNIIGSGGIVATTSNGAVTLSGTNTYSGGTVILGGTVKLGSDNAIGSGALTFGDGSSATGNLELDLFDQTVSSLSVASNSSGVNTITIGSGKTLTVNGPLSVGLAADNQTTNLTVTGGKLAVDTAADINFGRGQASSANPGSFATADLSGLEEFTASVNNFNLSKRNTGENRTYATTVLLSNTSNTITATAVSVNDTGGSSFTTNTTTTSTFLTLGTGVNVINTDTLDIGRNHGNGTVQFASQAAESPGSLTLRGKSGAGSKVDINIAINSSSSGNAGAFGKLDLRGHTVTVAAGTLTIASASQGTSSGDQSDGGFGTLSFDSGTFDVDTLTMATKTGAAVGPANATINVGGGHFTVNPTNASSSPLTIGSWASGSGSSSSAIATINITGGTFTSNTDIVEGAEATAGKVTSTINLDGGTLDMTGRVLGDTRPITHLNLMSGTLSNVGQINDGASGLHKTTAGTLILSGANTYSGDTTVSEGTLDITGSHTTGANYAVSGGATLITNNIRVTSTLTVDGSATIRANGGTAGASKVETLSIGTGGVLNLKDNDLVVGTGLVGDVRSQIITGLGGTNGIISDAAAAGVHGIGYAAGNNPNLSPSLGGMLSGQSFDGDSVLVKFTYRGDADLDGDSDLDDLGFWANSFTGDLGNPGTPATFWTQGDWDYDGDTDLDDLGFWSSTFTGDLGGGGLSVYAPNASEGAIAALAQMGITAVPEPGSICLLLIGACAIGLKRYRRPRERARDCAGLRGPKS